MLFYDFMSSVDINKKSRFGKADEDGKVCTLCSSTEEMVPNFAFTLTNMSTVLYKFVNAFNVTIPDRIVALVCYFKI
jgi:hypothetical protein